MLLLDADDDPARLAVDAGLRVDDDIAEPRFAGSILMGNGINAINGVADHRLVEIEAWGG